MLGTIAGFAGAAVTDLIDTPRTAFSYAAGTLTVKSGTTTEATLHLTNRSAKYVTRKGRCSFLKKRTKKLLFLEFRLLQ